MGMTCLSVGHIHLQICVMLSCMKSLKKSVKIITMLLFQHHGVSNHWQFNCLHNRLLRLTRKISKFCITAHCEGNHQSPLGFPHKMPMMLEVFHTMMSSYLPCLIHWDWDKMATVSQTTLSNACSWMKMLEFRLRFHWSLFLRVQLTIIHHWLK